MKILKIWLSLRDLSSRSIEGFALITIRHNFNGKQLKCFSLLQQGRFLKKNKLKKILIIVSKERWRRVVIGLNDEK
jgi:hypothetical protein